MTTRYRKRLSSFLLGACAISAGLILSACSAADDKDKAGSDQSVDIMTFTNIETETLCDMMRAASAGTDADAGDMIDNCVVTGQNAVAMVTVGNGPSLNVRYVSAGEEIAAQQSDGWGETKPGTAPGFVSNYTGAFVIDGIDGQLCADINYVALDRSNDSNFTHVGPAFTRVQQGYRVEGQDASLRTYTYDDGEAIDGVYYFVMTPREPGLEISTINFSVCE